MRCTCLLLFLSSVVCLAPLQMQAQSIQTVVGSNFDGFGGDGGPATNAELSSPTWAALWTKPEISISPIRATTEFVR